MDYNNINRRSGNRREEHEDRSGRRLFRLCFCIFVFAVAFLIKVCSPSLSEKISGQVLEAINNNVDYKAAFSSVGNFVSGKYTIGEAIEAIKEEGGLSTTDEQQKTEHPDLKNFTGSGIAQFTLQKNYLKYLNSRLKLGDASDSGEAQEAMAYADTSVTDSPDTSSCPDNVSTEYLELPFEHTVPVSGIVSSPFGYRTDPFDETTKFHYGVDIDASEGTDIAAFADGTIEASGISESAGKYVIIDHGDGWISQYFHCSEVFKTGGSEVKRGDVIAAVGQTGNATGPNLHFEILHDGIYYDPELYLKEET